MASRTCKIKDYKTLFDQTMNRVGGSADKTFPNRERKKGLKEEN